MSAQKNRLGRVGMAAIQARMSDTEIQRDPAAAMKIAQDAMRATLDLPKPKDAE